MLNRIIKNMILIAIFIKNTYTRIIVKPSEFGNEVWIWALWKTKISQKNLELFLDDINSTNERTGIE